MRRLWIRMLCFQCLLEKQIAHTYGKMLYNLTNAITAALRDDRSCVQSSKTLCPETSLSHSLPNPPLILHPASGKRSAVYHSVRTLGFALAASLSPALEVSQSPSTVISAPLIALRSTHFPLFPLQLPCLRSYELL